MGMSASESSSTPKKYSSKSTQRGDSGQPVTPHPAGESPGSGQIEQRTAVAPGVEAKESRYLDGLVRVLARVTSDPFDISHAVEDLRGLIEETVRREIGALRREVNGAFDDLRGEMNVRFEAIESQLTMIRWMLGATITLLVALFILVVDMALSENRSDTPPPPPPSAAVQAPARTETGPPIGAEPGSQAPSLVAPGEPSVRADPPADQPRP